MSMQESIPHRDYAALRTPAAAIAHLPSREARMEAFADLWWSAFAAFGVSWAGFYVDCPHEPDAQRMILAARRPGPARAPRRRTATCRWRSRRCRAGRPP
jgi:hypothetical protein